MFGLFKKKRSLKKEKITKKSRNKTKLIEAKKKNKPINNLKNKKSIALNSNTKKNSYLETNFNKESLEEFKKLQKKFNRVTILNKEDSIYFESLYKLAYDINSTRKFPRWVRYFNLLFMGEKRKITFSKFDTSAELLPTIESILNIPLTEKNLYNLIYTLEFIINQMIKFYNEGINRNYNFKDSISDLKTLGLVTSNVYRKLQVIAEVKKQIKKAYRFKDITFATQNGEILSLVDAELDFKYIFSEVYINLLYNYTIVQSPYLKKLYYLYDENRLTDRAAVNFYYI